MIRGDAYRRHKEFFHKKRAVSYLKIRDNYWQFNNPFWHNGRYGNFISSWEDPSIIGAFSATRHPCSCAGCGGRRRYEGKTKQEIFNELDFKEQLDEINSSVSALDITQDFQS